MTHKRVKRRKINLLKVIIFLLILYIIGFFIFNILNSKIKNIYVLNNNLISDQEIIDSAKLTNYPSFFLTNSFAIKNNILKNNKLIKKVEVSKKLWFEVIIKVTEYKPLFIDANKNLVLNEELKIDNYDKNISVPILITDIPNNLYNYFVEQYQKIDSDIQLKISEIKYEPNDIDKERFFLTMADGNYVYLTLYKFESINSYASILSTLENKKGILYLDSGNYFDIFK